MSNEQFINIRRDLHQIPEIGFQEKKTQQYLLNYLATLPQEHLEVSTWKTGIFVRVAGENPTKTIGYRTDIDGLPITEETGLPFASTHEGKMHACGHDVHMSIALGVLTHFTHHRVDDHLLFLFQPAEEGPGGALPMMEAEQFQKWKPDFIVALHVAPEYPVGTIATREGILFANTSELFIDLHGKGGHAAFPHETKDMIVAASHLVTQLQTIVSRNVNPLDSGVITIGKITGGTVQNIIAEKARLEGTIRTLSDNTMTVMKSRIEAIVSGIKAAFECKATIDYGSNYRQVDNEPKLTREFMTFIEENTDVTVIDCDKAMTGEDYGYFLKEVPGFMFWLGVASENGLHHAKMAPDEAAIGQAIDLLTSYLTDKATIK
jgi:N-acetyldiaminopimelate deacetylase